MPSRVQLAHVFANDNENKKVFSVRVKTIGEMKQAVAEAQAFDGVSFIECIIDPDDCSKQLLEWGS
eukprot:25922-Eustigmatos_ZCMA.PRE.1